MSCTHALHVQEFLIRNRSVWNACRLALKVGIIAIAAGTVWGPWLLWAKAQPAEAGGMGYAGAALLTVLLVWMGARVAKMPEGKPRWEALEPERKMMQGIGNTFRHICGQVGVTLPRELEKASAIK